MQVGALLGPFRSRRNMANTSFGTWDLVLFSILYSLSLCNNNFLISVVNIFYNTILQIFQNKSLMLENEVREGFYFETETGNFELIINSCNFFHGILSFSFSLTQMCFQLPKFGTGVIWSVPLENPTKR